MSIRGKSYAGGFGVAEETTFGVPNPVPDAWLPITSEDIQTTRPAIQRGGIYTSREVQCQQAGLEVNAGSFSLEADAIALGLPLKWLIGDVESSTFGGTIAAAAVAVAGTTGALPNGAYQWRVANVFQRTWDGALHIGAAAPLSTAINLSAGGTGSAALTWTNAAPPAGYTLAGSALYRQIGAGDCTMVHYLNGSAATYTDVGGAVPADYVDVLPAEQSFLHTFIPPDVTDESDLPSFTVTKLLDVQYSTQIDGCKISEMSVNVAEDGNAPVEFQFGVLGRRALKVANLVPSHSPICSMVSWQSRVTMDGVVSQVAKAMSLTINQNMESQRALNGSQFVRDHSPGMLEVSGQLTSGFENHEQWDRLKTGTKFNLENRVEGGHTTPGAAFRVDENTVASPFPFAFEAHMPSCLYDGGAGGNLNGGDIMNETPGYRAGFSATHGYSVRLRLQNLTPAY